MINSTQPDDRRWQADSTPWLYKKELRNSIADDKTEKEFDGRYFSALEEAPLVSSRNIATELLCKKAKPNPSGPPHTVALHFLRFRCVHSRTGPSTEDGEAEAKQASGNFAISTSFEQPPSS